LAQVVRPTECISNTVASGRFSFSVFSQLQYSYIISAECI